MSVFYCLIAPRLFLYLLSGTGYHSWLCRNITITERQQYLAYFSEARKWACVRLPGFEKTRPDVECLLHNKGSRIILITHQNEALGTTEKFHLDKAAFDIQVLKYLSVFFYCRVDCIDCSAGVVLFCRPWTEIVFVDVAAGKKWDVARMYICCCSRYENHWFSAASGALLRHRLRQCCWPSAWLLCVVENSDHDRGCGAVLV